MYRSQWFACRGPCERLNVTLNDYSQAAEVTVRVSGLCLMCGSGSEYIQGLVHDQEQLNKNFSPQYYAGEKQLRYALKKDGFHKRCPAVYAAVTGLGGQRKSKRRPTFKKDVREYDRPDDDEDGGGGDEYAAAGNEEDEQEPYIGEIPEFMTDTSPAEDDVAETLVEQKPDQDDVDDSLSESGEKYDIDGDIAVLVANSAAGSVCCFCSLSCPRGDDACSRCMMNFTL